MSIATSLPTDADNRRFAGPNGKLPAGTTTADASYAVTHVALVDASNNPLVSVAGGALLTSAARTTSTVTADQTNRAARGVLLYLDITATPNDAQTLTLFLQVKDPASGKYQNFAAFTALVASALGAAPTTATYLYTLLPGATETIASAVHELQALALPSTWRVVVSHSAAGAWTYTLGYSLLV